MGQGRRLVRHAAHLADDGVKELHAAHHLRLFGAGNKRQYGGLQQVGSARVVFGCIDDCQRATVGRLAQQAGCKDGGDTIITGLTARAGVEIDAWQCRGQFARRGDGCDQGSDGRATTPG